MSIAEASGLDYDLFIGHDELLDFLYTSFVPVGERDCVETTKFTAYIPLSVNWRGVVDRLIDRTLRHSHRLASLASLASLPTDHRLVT